MNSWRGQHKRVEQQFLAFIGTDAVLALKGGAALCGGLWLRALGEKGYGYGAAGDCIRHYWHGLLAQVQNQIQHALSENGLEQFDAVSAVDKDELIDRTRTS